MHGHILVQFIHTGLLPLNECHCRFPVARWSWYYLKNESLLCCCFLQYTKPGLPTCIVFGKTCACNEDDSWIDCEYEALVACYWQWKIKILKEKSVPVALCTPQIPHGLAWDLWWTTWRGTGFSPTRPTLVFPCQCHSTTAPHSFNRLPQTLSSISSKTELVVRGKLTVLFRDALFAVRPKCFHFK